MPEAVDNLCWEQNMSEPKEKPETVHTNPQYQGKLYGIELEIEAAGLYAVEEVFQEDSDDYETINPTVPKGWLREQEDSIQGVELLSELPFDFETSVTNIINVFADIERQHFIPTRTPRGSTHIHANVADLTWEQMKSFVLACAWAEPTLIELAGKGRKGNLFAQSYETTPIGWANVIDWCRRKLMIQIVDTHYMAVSFYPMTYLGSVEFRMGPSSRNADEAIRWLKCIDTVVTAGRETVVGLEEPPFLSVLLSKFDHKKQKQLRAKGLKQATEIYYAIHEPYNPPQLSRKKSVSVPDIPSQIYQNSLSAAIDSMNQESPTQAQSPSPYFYPSYADFSSYPEDVEPPVSSLTSFINQPWMEGCNCPSCQALKAEALNAASNNPTYPSYLTNPSETF